MPRRASSNVHPAWLIAILVLLVIAIGGGYFLFNKVSDPFRTLAPLPISDYLENSSSLRGNVYRVTGTIDNQLAWSPTKGRLFSIDVGKDVLPILIPAKFNSINVQKNQQFAFELTVADQGVLEVQDVKKM